MKNSIRRSVINCIAGLLVLATLFTVGCGSEKRKENPEEELVFSVLLRDSQSGSHYQMDIKCSECTATQASVLARLQDSKQRITVSVPKSPETMTPAERKALISLIVSAYENEGGPSNQTPNTDPIVDVPEELVTLSLSDRSSGNLYDFTFDVSKLDKVYKTLVLTQAEVGTMLVNIEKDPLQMTEDEKEMLIQDVLDELYMPGPVSNPKATVLVDAGHGFTNSYGVPDKGTGDNTPYHTLTGKYESDLNLAIAMRLKEKLIKAGYAVIMIRESQVDEHLHINDRVRRINSLGADMMISIHGNAAAPAASGARVYWHSDNDAPEFSKEYAETVAEAINEVAGTTLVPATVYEGDYAVVRDVHIPSVLVETCFLTNEEDASLVSDPLWIERMADALCSGIDRQCAK